MDSTRSYVKQVYISRNILIEYLKNMGYDCKAYENFSIEDVESMKKYNQLDFKVNNVSTNENCYILYKLDESFKQNVVKRNNIEQHIHEVYEEKILIENKDTLVIVTTEYTNESIHKVLKNIWENQKKFIVILTLANLQINLLKHTFVPKHTKMTDEEKSELYKKYNISNDLQLPQISRFDAAAKSIFLRPGQVCKITRYDKISLMNDYYRICIS
jgi:DNA-directed RNA polymerase subunit H (RpoH/RPB5)